MRKLLFALTVLCMITSFTVQATIVTTVNVATTIVVQETEVDTADAPAGFTQELKKRFIEGGPGFMGIVLILSLIHI